MPSLPETRSTISSARPGCVIRVSSPSNQSPWYGGAKSARTSQYGSGTNAWISRSRRTIIASVGVWTRPSETTPPTQARPRIVAARVAFMPTSQSASERERAAASNGSSCSARTEPGESVPDRLLRHRRDPEPLDRLVNTRRVDDVSEDQLALAPGVAGVDHAVDVLAREQLVDRLELLLRLGVAGAQLELCGDDRQVGHPPFLELLVVLLRVYELDEVADGERDDVLVGLEEGLLLGETSRGARRRCRGRRTASLR